MATTTTIDRRRVIVGLAAAMLVSALVGSATANAGDLRSPDARDAGVLARRAAHPAPTRTDFRSPDARDAAVRADVPPGDAGYVGLRTPVAPVVASPVAQVAPAPHSSVSGLSWGYVALMLALALAAGMGFNKTLRRRRLGRLLARRS